MTSTTDEATGIDRVWPAGGKGARQGPYRGLFEHSPVSLWEEDASEVKKYLDGLRQSGAEDIRTYLDYHPEEVAKCAALVKVLAVNAATADLYEAGSAADLLANIDKVLCEESYDVLKQTLVAVAEGKRCFEADTFNRTLKGKKKHLLMRWSVAPGYEDTYERVWVSMLDLTEHELFAKELDDTDRRYRMFAEYVNDLIWTMDMGLSFTFVSPSVQKTLGFTPEEIMSKQMGDLLTPASLEVAMTAVAEELAPDAMRNCDPRRSRVLELEFITSSRSTIWGELNMSFMLDGDSIPTGIVGVIRDVTDRRLAREALERSWQAQKIINDLLQISLEDITRDEMLQEMISCIVDVPWFSRDSQGCILLKDRDSDMLVMKASAGPGAKAVKACERRRVGECFCGTAATTGQIMYRAGVGGTELRQCQPEGDRSQYCVPFSYAGGLLGVLNLYLEQGHPCSEKEMEFLSAVGRVLASCIGSKKATETLRRSEASYRSIFDKASDSIFIHDPETGRILDVNRRTCEIFGYTYDQMLAMNVGAISAGDSPFSQEEALGLIRKAATDGPQLFEWHCRDRSGRLFWVEVNLSYARLGSGSRVLAFVRDIDARKRAEERVLALSRFLEGIMDTVDVWISAADRDANVLVWNEAATRISGYSRDEVIGSDRIWTLMYPDEAARKKYMEDRSRALSGAVSCDRHRTSIVTRSGESRTLALSSFPLADDRGNPCGAIGLALDVTDETGDRDPAADLRDHVVKALQSALP